MSTGSFHHARLGPVIVAMIAILGASSSGQQPASRLPPIPAEQFESAAYQTAPNDDQIRRVVEEVVEDVLRSRGAQGAIDSREHHGSVPSDSDDVPLADLVSEHLSVTLNRGGKLQIYGFGRGDLIYTDSRLSSTIVPFFVLSEDPVSPTPVPENDAQFNANVRLTRLGFEYGGTRAQWLGCPELSAKIEIDFETLLNITSESRAVPRIRHAYGKMTWGEFSLLLGETFDAISPLNPMINDDSLMWNAGNLGDRRPQLRTDWDHDLGCDRRFIVATAISSGGAIDQQDLDGNGLKDGEDSAVPAVQQRMGYRFPAWCSHRTAELGVSWLVSFESVDTPIGGESDFVSRGVGLDWSLPLSHRATWRGETWYGRDLSDWRGGIAQGVNTTTGKEIESRGGWTELQFEPYEWYRVAAGFTVDDPVNGDLIGNTTLRTLNTTWYMGNRFDFGAGLNIYVNLEFWETKYLGLDEGDAFRFKTVLIQRF